MPAHPIEQTVDAIAQQAVDAGVVMQGQICNNNSLGKIGMFLQSVLSPVAETFNSLVAKTGINDLIIVGGISLLASWFFVSREPLSRGVMIFILAGLLYFVLREAGFGG